MVDSLDLAQNDREITAVDISTSFFSFFLGALIEFLVGNHYPGLGAVVSISFIGGRVMHILKNRSEKSDADSSAEINQ